VDELRHGHLLKLGEVDLTALDVFIPVVDLVVAEDFGIFRVLVVFLVEPGGSEQREILVMIECRRLGSSERGWLFAVSLSLAISGAFAWLALDVALDPFARGWAVLAVGVSFAGGAGGGGRFGRSGRTIAVQAFADGDPITFTVSIAGGPGRSGVGGLALAPAWLSIVFGLCRRRWRRGAGL
jgi:hypothetical protein